MSKSTQAALHRAEVLAAPGPGHFSRALGIRPKEGETSGGPQRAGPAPHLPACPGSWGGTIQWAWLQGVGRAGLQNWSTAHSSPLTNIARGTQEPSGLCSKTAWPGTRGLVLQARGSVPFLSEELALCREDPIGGELTALRGPAEHRGQPLR